MKFFSSTYSALLLTTISSLSHAVAPVISSDAPIDAQVNQTYTYQLQANDPEGSELTYYFGFAPQAMTVSNTGLISWSPQTSDVGEHTYKIFVEDEEDLSAFQYVTLNVTDPSNNTPVIHGEPVLEALTNNAYSFDIQATDIDGDSLIYTLTSYPVAQGLTISDAGVINWTPNNTQIGEYWVWVTVDDGRLGEAKLKYKLSAIDPNNRAPVIANTSPVTVVNVGQTYVYDLDASDLDGDPLQYNLQVWPEVSGISISSDGIVQWTPSIGDVEEYQVIAEVDDGKLGKDSISYKLEVVNTGNAVPVFDSTPLTSITVNTQYSYDVNASDAENNTLTYSLDTAPTGMTIDSATGLINWLPSQVGNYNIVVAVEDGINPAVTQAFTINVNPEPNTLPIANGADLSVSEDTTLQITLDATDSDGDALTYTILSQPQNGSLTGEAPQLTYVPNANFNGTDTLSFQVNDGTADSAPATVNINITPVNDSPVANAQIITTNEDSSTAITLTATDIEGSALTYTVVTQPQNGVLTGQAPNLTYTPNENFNGADTLSFQVSDGSANSAAATITINVASENDAPVASAQTITTNEDTSTAIILMATDTEGSALTYTIVTQPQNGVLAGEAPNLTYTPNENFNGSDTLSFQVSDGSVSSAPAIITFDIAPINDIPVANTQQLNVNEDSSLNITLSGNDIDGDILTFSIVGQVQNGVITGEAPNLVYTPNTDFNGTDTLTYRVNDGVVDSALATLNITVNAVNDVPVAITETITTNEDTSTAIILSGTDIEGSVLTYTVVTQPQNGVLTGEVPNLIYTPNENFNGSDTLSFEVSDGSASSAPAIITFDITAINDIPVANTQQLNVNEDSSLNITLSGNDIDGDALTFSIVGQVQNGVISGEVPNLVYTPNTNFNGTDTLTYRVNDGLIDSALATLNISVSAINDTPVAVEQSLTAEENASLNIVLSASDIDSDTLTYAVVTPPQSGELTGTAPNLIYTPDANFSGADSFVFIANDGELNSENTTVTIDVLPADDGIAIISEPPKSVIQGHIYEYPVEALSLSDSTLSYALIDGPNGMVIDSNSGRITWLAGEPAQHPITLEVTDGQGEALQQSYTLNVVPEQVDASYIGRDFWFMFNRQTVVDTDFSSNEFYVYISSTSVNVTNINLEIPGLNFQTSIDVAPGEVGQIDLSELRLQLGFETLGIESNSIHLTASEDVSVVLYNFSQDSSDTSLVLPTTALTQDYQVTAYQSLRFSRTRSAEFGENQPFMGIVATSNNTTLTITPTVDYSDGIATRVADIAYDIQLSAGETYQVYGSGDLTNTRIQANEPVAVFAGNVCTFIQAAFCDHIVEQVLPLTTWAADYYIMPFALRQDGDTFQVYASEDDTVIKVDDFYLISLNQGEFYEFIIDSPARVHANKPFALTQFSNGALFDNVIVDGETIGDPAMLIVQPEDHYLNRYIVSTVPDTLILTSGNGNGGGEGYQGPFRHHYANLIAQGAIRNTITLDGDPIDVTWQPIPNSSYFGASLELNAGEHLIAGAGPFGLTMYGFDAFDSYAHYGGSAFTRSSIAGSLSLQRDGQGDLQAGDSACVVAHLEDELGDNAVRVPAVFTLIDSANAINDSQTVVTNSSGNARACFTHSIAGTANISVQWQTLAQALSLTWQAYDRGVNRPPQIHTLPAFFATPDTAYTYAVGAVDPNLDELIYTITEGPSGLSIDNTTGLISYVVPGDFHEARVTIQVSDGELIDQQSYRLAVPPGFNRAPAFLSQPPSADLTANRRFDYAVEVLDPDYDPGLIFNVVQGPAGMIIREDALLSWTPVSTQVGTHDIIISADDRVGGFTEQAFTLNVIPDSIPEFTEPNAEDVQAVTGHTFIYRVIATDNDGDALSFSLSGHPNGMTISNTIGSEGTIRWVPSAAQVGEFTITVNVSDGFNSTSITFPVTVTLNQPPVFTSTPITTIAEGHEYFYEVSLTDPEGDLSGIFPVLVEGPQGLSVTSNRVLWNPTTAQIGEHIVTLQHSDGFGGVATQTYTLTVVPNSAPILVSEPPTVAVVGQRYEYPLVAEDVDGDRASFLRVIAPAGMSAFSTPTSQTITWTPNSSQIGEHPVLIRASDFLGASSEQSFTITVRGSNTAPVVTDPAPQTIQAQRTYTTNILVTDADNDTLSYSLLNAPAGMVIDSQGQLTWTPTSAQLGNVRVPLFVNDPFGGQDATVVDLTVEPFSNSIPEYNEDLPRRAVVDRLYTVTIAATDADGDALSYSFNQAPTGMVISDQGVINWTPSAEQVGEHAVELVISDGFSTLTITASITVIAELLPLEVAASVTPQFVGAGEQTELNIALTGGLNPIVSSITVNGEAIAIQSIHSYMLSDDLPGRRDIVIQASDSETGETATTELFFSVADLDDTTAPVLTLVNPTNEAIVTEPIDVIASIADSQIAQWQLFYRRANANPNDVVVLAEGRDAVSEQSLAVFDPSQMVNGLYTIVLQAEDISGNQSVVGSTVFVDGELKVGNFSFSVEDISLPMAGIPIRVTRTYDSRRRQETLDFGHGWTVDYQSLIIDEASEPSQGWERIQQRVAFDVDGAVVVLNGNCLKPTLTKRVTITLPNDQVEEFTARATSIGGGAQSINDPDCYLTAGNFYDITFEALPGTESSLSSSDGTNLFFDASLGQLSDIGDFEPQAITRYTLTTRAGYVYQLNQEFGIEQVIDPNGYSLTYSDSGIVHSSGKAITFERDDQNRITALVDPRGHRVEYTYSAAGDLTFVRDRDTAVTEYTYASDHGLIDIIDPLERRVVRNLYDDEGRLTGQEDENGVQKFFTHSIDVRTSLVTDLDGRSTLFNYDARGNVTEETIIISDDSYDADILTTYSYDINDNQETRTIGESTWTTLHNDTDDVLESRNPENQSMFYEGYNALGLEGSITDERGNTYTMTYDAVGNLLGVDSPEVTDADTSEVAQPSATNTINSVGLVTSTTDLRGLTTTYTYYTEGPAAGQKHTESNPITGTMTYTYDANNNVATETRQRTINGVLTDEVTSYQYDGRDRLTRTNLPDGTYTETSYDLAGNIATERDRFGNVTSYEYDVYGRLTLTTYPDSTTEVRTYSAEGLLMTVTDRRGRTTTNEYDDAQRLRFVRNPDQTFTETRYTIHGWVAEEYDERRNLTEYRYDLAGRRTRMVRHYDGITQEHSFSYYPNGEVQSETDDLGRTTTYVLNELDQRIEMQYHNNTRMQERYDFMGTRTRSIDQEDRATRFDYDDLGRLVGVIHEVTIDDEAVPPTTYSYDEVGNRLTQTDAEGRTTTWTYDVHGRMLTRTLPEGQQEIMVYTDGQGCAIDAGINCVDADSPRTIVQTDFNGDTIIMAYDIMGRMVSMQYSKDGLSEVYTYYPNDQLHTVTDQHGTTTYEYDVRDRLIREIRPDGTQMDYTYDAASNRTSVSITRGGVITSSTTYTYDQLNRLSTAIDANGTTTYIYDDVGNMQSVTYPNGLRTEYLYNSINQLTDVVTRDVLNTIITHYQYGLNPTGRRASITELDGRITDYVYDNLYRLSNETITDAVNGNYTANYQYDWVGNRTFETVDGVSTAYTYDRNDRLIQTGGTTFTYDNNGNTLTETLDGVVKTYTWDGKNQLVNLNNAGNETQYQYNHNRVRQGKTEAGITTRFIIDENRDYAQVLEEVADNNATVTYTYGHDLINQERTGTVSYYHYDGLGSTRALSDASGSLTDSYDYEAFGETLNSEGFTDNAYLFTGEQLDASLDQYYLRARYYSQAQGRFTRMDTWHGFTLNPVTLNKYLYANADAVNGIDPSGLFTLSEATATNNIVAIQSVGAISRVSIGFAANDAIIAGSASLTATQVGLSVLRVMGVVGLSTLLESKESDDDPDETINVYHGSFNATAVRSGGLRLDNGTQFVSRDIRAAQDAIGPHRPGIETATDPGIVISRIPEDEFVALLLPLERSYNGFYPYLIRGSSEITLRTPLHIQLFNTHIVR